jgi:hypothetical protein
MTRFEHDEGTRININSKIRDFHWWDSDIETYYYFLKQGNIKIIKEVRGITFFVYTLNGEESYYKIIL